MSYKLRYILLLVFLLQCVTGNAATFCVGNSAEFQQALITTASNGEADQIHLLEGQYSVSSGSDAFAYVSSNHEYLSIAGGYSSPGGQPCSKQTYRARLTVLSGSHVRRVFSAGDAQVGVFNLTIQDGYSTGSGAGIRAESSGYNDIVIVNVIFDGNVSEASGGGIEIISSGTPTIRGSLFMRNLCRTNGCAVYGVLNGPNPVSYLFAFGGNTVVGNYCLTDAPTTCVTGGVKFSGSAGTISYNNAFAYNGGFDLDIEGAVGKLYNSNVPNKRGTFAPNVGNLGLVNPGFTNPADGNLRLSYGSPLIDSGVSPDAFPVPVYDLEGNSRFHVPLDMGAFERPESQLFFDPFESY